MKLSIVVSTQPASFSALAYQGEVEKSLAKIAAWGYEGVELAVRDPSLLEVAHIEKIISEKNLSVPAIGTGQAYGEEGLSFTHPDGEVRKKAMARLNAHIDFASHFEALVIIGLIRGKVLDSVKRPQAMQWLVEALRQCAAAANEKGIKLAVEPINRYETNLVNTVAEGLDLIGKAGAENVGLLLDTFHMNIEEPSLEASIRQAGRRLFHVHIADSNRWYPGAGHLDFARVVSALQQARYDGYLSAEILPLPDADTCAERAMKFVRALLADGKI
jgi:sugar phosphate isomerase/epimerase